MSYHPALEQCGSGVAVPVGAGQLPHDHVVVVEWNDRAGVERAFAQHGRDLSAIFCEALLCNSGSLPADAGFLEFLRTAATKAGALLVFDEVITGFRLDLRGAQGRYGVTPDLAVFAKAVGAGAPLSVLAGKAEYMDWISEGKVVHAGTLNGNPLSLAAAAAALDELSTRNGDCFHWMRERTARLRHGLEAILRATGHPVVTTGDGPVFSVHFMEKAPRTYRDTLAGRPELYGKFALGLMAEGVLVLPDGRWYLSTAHTETDIEQTLAAAQHAARDL